MMLFEWHVDITKKCVTKLWEFKTHMFTNGIKLILYY